jgi:hypothetical protein
MEDTGDAWDSVSCKRMPSQIDVVSEVLDDGDMGEDSTEEADVWPCDSNDEAGTT